MQDKLTKLAELQEDRESTQRRLDALDEEIDRLVGDGIIVGGVKIVPLKRKKHPLLERRTVRDEAPSLTHVPFDDEVEPRPKGPALDSKGQSDLVLAAFKDLPKASANEIQEATGLPITQVRNALYWLKRQGKIEKEGWSTYKLP